MYSIQISLGACGQDSDASAVTVAPSTSQMPGKELFREQDVTLRWKTVQRTVRFYTLHVLLCFIHLQSFIDSTCQSLPCMLGKTVKLSTLMH